MRCRFPGPQLPAQTTSSPVRCASAPAAKAATSSCRTWIQESPVVTTDGTGDGGGRLTIRRLGSLTARRANTWRTDTRWNMFRRSAVLAFVLSLSAGSAALAQSSVETSTVTKTSVRSGVIQTISGNKVTVQGARGLDEYTVPAGFQFQVDGKDVGLEQLKPGTQVSANITDEITTRQVTVTKVIDGKVVQLAPSGFVLLDRKGKYVSYDYTDREGNDIYFLDADGQQKPLENLELGDRLTGTMVTRFPPQVIDQRTLQARASAPAPQSAPATVAIAESAVVEKKTLPRTGSLLPLVGLLAAVSAAVALTLRGVRARA